MNFPDDLLYTENDEWIRLDGEDAVMGITDYAQDQLSDIVFVEFTASEGDEIAKDEMFSTVESVKAASDVYMPVSGTVVEFNGALEDAPELINSDPYGEAWMVKVKVNDPSELDSLMDSTAYESYCQERDH